MKVSDIEVSLIDRMGDDLSVVNAARVSFHKESEWNIEWADFQTDTGATPYWKTLKPADEKLIKYLAKHKHYSPFNHTFISVRVKAPIFVARQLVKHEYMPWNEVSRRYVDEEPEFYVPNVWRGKAENVKQGSSEVEVLDAHAVNTVVLSTCLQAYKELLRLGVCPEQARMILPQNTMTEWIWSGTLKAFAKMLQLRLDPHTQKESREVAEKIRDIIVPCFPVSLPALLESEVV